MNERERAEFERHKIRAEQQLNQMYYGANKKAQTNDGASRSAVFSQPVTNKNNTKSQGTSTAKASTVKTAKPEEKPKSTLNTPLKRRSILNFLNFKGMKMDNDRLIILAICLLLAGEETDELLMLALIYIMI
ncbi:MAG: hypothetical protein J6C29_02750 [Clostridia bacterium]|nr:hypothetical protein [Clostridia bacterium]